ncbi:patatin-like phospholipase family protein [Alkalimarinus alittae]|uniref:Patatin-like phospholipase family protein n=1 Tax=Alkalimarinus alittae TaxID=2961619 RepID=A0ABY6N039_9ALTE|nr:patatin-like phospholipase family protein [Alkalimarinus alittae]UZE95468.1 patatin-like phospholipase family protein [Alkalimarinus alittae]
MKNNLSNIENVVFAGGGNRCFWQAGLWDVIAEPLNLNPKQFVSVSAGSAISCGILAGQSHECLRIVKATTSRNTKNRYMGNLFNADPVFPHERLYREMVLEIMHLDAFEQLKKGPSNAIQVARIPRWLGPKSAVAIGLMAYQLEKKLKEPVHPTYGRKLGFKSEFINAADCHSPEELTDLILSSSCTPPMTPIMYRDNRPVLDGGLFDNAPVHGVAENSGDTLVLLTRPYRNIPPVAGRYYLSPSQKPPVSSWDYTNPQGVQATFDLGRRDGETLIKEMQSRQQ